MARRTPLITIADPEQISSGLAPDRHAIFKTLWETASNVRFYQGKVRRLIPAATAFDIGNAVLKARGLHQQQNSNGTRWLWLATVAGTALTIRKWYGPAPTLIYSQTDSAISQDDTLTKKATQVDFLQWGNWTLFNDGISAIRRYKETENAVDILPNAPSSAVAYFKKQNHLVAVGTGAGRRGVNWSHADNIELWTAAETNMAGSLTIEELQTPMRGAARLGQHIACYTEDQMAFVYWTGVPFYYGQRVALDGIGVTGKQAVCTDGRLNFGMSRNGAWQTDGNEFRYIDTLKMFDYFQEVINWDQGGKIIVTRNDVTRCIEFHFPTGSSLENNEAWSYEPATGNWAPVIAYQAAVERMIFDKPLRAKDGIVYMLDDNPDTSQPLSLISKPLMVATEDNPGLHLDTRIDEVEIAALLAVGIEFRISNAVDVDGPWHSSAWQVVTPDLRIYRMEQLPTGTFHRIEFRSVTNNWSLDLQGFAMFGNLEGVKRDTI